MSTRIVVITAFLVTLLENTLAEREHKVHNIVLYPEKHSWCQITPIQQIVASPGYKPVTIENNVCVGACYSYSIPKTEPAEPGELIGPYCDSCQPSEIKCYHVNLSADEKNEGPPILQKRVQIITNCSCQTCDKIRKEDCEITDENTLELPQNLFSEDKKNYKPNVDELPDLLEVPDQNATHHLNTENDRNKLKKWFERLQNTTDHRAEEFYSGDQEHKINIEKYNSFGLEHNQDINAKIEKDLESLPDTFGLEGVPSHHKGNHVGMGIRHTENDIALDDLPKKHHDSVHHSHHSGHHQHHGESHHLHHLGEEQQIGMNIVHLTKGPHHSMIASPVEEKLHIDSDDLKPNNEGVIIDYENHHKKPHKVADLLDN